MEHVAGNVRTHLFIKDSKLGWKLAENSSVRHVEPGKIDVTYETDNNGLRKINNSEEKSDFSMYFFGDSFTFGHGVNNHETFPAIIKGKHLEKNVNVYNAGVMGYGIVQMFQRFLMLEDQIQPGDLVIFTPISNDIKRNQSDFYFPYFIQFTNVLKLDNFPFFNDGVVTYRKLENNFYNTLKLVAGNARYSGDIYKAVRSKLIPDTTKETHEMIKIIERKTRLKGAKFVLIFLPKTEECLSGKYAVDISGFSYIDIMHYFPKEEPELNSLRIAQKDSHWNKRGHEIAAKAIVQTLIKEDIIDKRYVRDN
ncbi:MAG: SGNH/GDSL hydrolase family protein [Candidatus Mariimomonas ferrooxydans]